MRVIFAGTPQAAVPALLAIHEAGHEIVAVLTREDSAQGRKKIRTPSHVAAVATGRGFNVIKTNQPDAAVDQQLRAVHADIGVVVAYGALLAQSTLDIPRLGWVNIHFSLLPDWRGAAPVQWQILSGAQEAGLSLFQLVPALDAGDVLMTRVTGIEPDETATDLLHRLSQLGASAVCELLTLLESGTVVPQPQSGETRYARKLTSADGWLDVHQPQDVVYAQFRAVTEEPGAYVQLQGARIKILELSAATTGENIRAGNLVVHAGELLMGTATGPLVLQKVQPAGKNSMPAMDWFRGLHQSELALDERV